MQPINYLRPTIIITSICYTCLFSVLIFLPTQLMASNSMMRTTHGVAFNLFLFKNFFNTKTHIIRLVYICRHALVYSPKWIYGCNIVMTRSPINFGSGIVTEERILTKKSVFCERNFNFFFVNIFVKGKS